MGFLCLIEIVAAAIRLVLMLIYDYIIAKYLLDSVKFYHHLKTANFAVLGFN